MTAASWWPRESASQRRLLTGAKPQGYGRVSGWGGLLGSSGPTGAMTAGRRPGRSEGGQDVRLSVPSSPPQPMAGLRQQKAGSGLKALPQRSQNQNETNSCTTSASKPYRGSSPGAAPLTLRSRKFS